MKRLFWPPACMAGLLLGLLPFFRNAARADAPDPGLHLPRTMALLESATPAHRTPVSILVYGQSIAAQGYADQAITRYLREKYPYAAITVRNTAIGGYQAPALRKTAWQDLYNQNPDLIIFHDYNDYGKGDEMDEIFANIHANLTAEMITWTHHVDNVDGNSEKRSRLLDAESETLQGLCARYGYEIADVRAEWKKHLEETKTPVQDYLKDAIHMNAKGGALLGEFLVPRFRPNPAAPDDWKKRVRTLPLEPSANWSASGGGLVSSGTQSLKIAFTGNRVDLEALGGVSGSATILLDGKTPSLVRDTLAVSRSSKSPGAWWPAISRVTLGEKAVAETYTMDFHDVSPDGSTWAFDLKGSVSGDAGSGKPGTDFVSPSGAVSIQGGDIALAGVKKLLNVDLPPRFPIEWEVYSMSQDTWKPSGKTGDGTVDQQTVIRCWTDGPHTLEIVPNGDGPVGIRSVIVFSPGGQDGGNQ